MKTEKALVTILFLVICFSAKSQTNSANKPVKPHAPAVVIKPPVEIKIQSIGADLATYKKCQISGESVPNQVLLKGLNLDLMKADADIKKLTAFIAKETVDIKNETKQLKKDKVNSPSEADYNSAAGRWIQELNRRQMKLEDREEALEQAHSDLEKAKSKFLDNSTMMAQDAGVIYQSIPVWRVTGKKPATK